MSVEIIWYIYTYTYISYIISSHIHILFWLVVDLPLWKIMEFVSWDDEIPNISGKKNVPNHQPVWYMISNYNSYMINIWVLYHILHNIISYSYSITYTHLSDATNARPQHPQHPHPQPLTPALRIQAFALASTSAGKKTTARYSTMVTPRPIHGSTLDILRRGWGWGWMGKAWKSRKKSNM